MTSKLTRERLEALANAEYCKSNPGAWLLGLKEVNELARMALAAMNGEPVRNPVLAYADSYRDMAKQGFESVPIWSVITDLERNIAPLYRHAQPAPVVPDIDELRLAFEATERESDDGFNLHKSGIGYADDATQGRWESWLACRDAMLAAAPQPQNAPQNIPEIIPDCWCRTCRPVVLNDMRFVVCPDCGNKRCPRANDHRNACTGSNEPGQEGSAYPAAPQSPGSEPSTVPGKWIPVSEQMPPSRHEVLVGRWWGEKPRWCCKWATYIPGHPDAQSSGWLIPGGSWTPTHWMELPAAPQEVK
ncbi:DUF551 domain-containing protein [Klebsiella pneumoniae]|nr:DUF551 domain-containing protein [Klebsiella pneumoniae]